MVGCGLLLGLITIAIHISLEIIVAALSREARECILSLETGGDVLTLEILAVGLSQVAGGRAMSKRILLKATDKSILRSYWGRNTSRKGLGLGT